MLVLQEDLGRDVVRGGNGGNARRCGDGDVDDAGQRKELASWCALGRSEVKLVCRQAKSL